MNLNSWSSPLNWVSCVQDLLLYVLNVSIIPGEDTEAGSAKPVKEEFSHMFSKWESFLCATCSIAETFYYIIVTRQTYELQSAYYLCFIVSFTAHITTTATSAKPLSGQDEMHMHWFESVFKIPQRHESTLGWQGLRCQCFRYVQITLSSAIVSLKNIMQNYLLFKELHFLGYKLTWKQPFFRLLCIQLCFRCLFLLGT